MIYRSDDLPQDVSLPVLRQVQEWFEKANKIQTMAILASQLDQRGDFVDFVNKNKNIDLALHGWVHDNYSLLEGNMIAMHLRWSLEAFGKHFNKYPSVWFLPWNGCVKGSGFDLVPRVANIAKDFGLEININCTDIKRYLGGDKNEVVYFHLWKGDELSLVPKLLEIE